MNKGNIIIAVVTILVFAGIGVIAYTQSQPPAQISNGGGELIAANGLHAHATVNIYENGELVQIPANVGLSGGHSPIHTHDPNNVVHLEFGGAVYEESIILASFFDVWERDFNERNLLGNTTNNGGEIIMTVNGATSSAYENYQMQDGDEIEIRYADTAAN